MAKRPDILETKDNGYFRLWSKWQDVWGNWQFWWQHSDDGKEWENVANGDLEWSQRMSNHYQIAITGEYTDEQRKSTQS